MRDIEAEGIRNHPERITTISQILDPLYLVIRIVGETCIKARHVGSLSNHDIRFLRVRFKASELRQRSRIALVVPHREVIVMKILARTKGLTDAPSPARVQLRFGVRDVPAVKVGTLFERGALAQLLVLEHRNDSDVLRVCQKLARKTADRIVGFRCGPNVHVCQPKVGGFRVLDGQIAERVDGEEIGVFLDDVRDVHVGTKLGCGAKLLEVGEVLGGEIIHDRHGSSPTPRNLQHEDPACQCSLRAKCNIVRNTWIIRNMAID